MINQQTNYKINPSYTIWFNMFESQGVTYTSKHTLTHNQDCIYICTLLPTSRLGLTSTFKTSVHVREPHKLLASVLTLRNFGFDKSLSSLKKFKLFNNANWTIDCFSPKLLEVKQPTVHWQENKRVFGMPVYPLYSFKVCLPVFQYLFLFCLFFVWCVCVQWFDLGM